MNKEYIEEIAIANAAMNYPDVDVSVVRDYMTGKTPEIKYGELKPKTNGDRIRSMSDEELAVEATAHGGCPHNCETPDDMDTDCVKCWLDWLKQEADDGASAE